MLRFITWSDFTTAIAFCCSSYWLVILLIYYRRELRGAFKLHARQDPVSISQPVTGEEDLFERCSRCSAVIKTLIRENSLKTSGKENLLAEIKAALISHRDFKNTVWEIPINNLIKFETAQRCSIILDDQEVKSVWAS